MKLRCLAALAAAWMLTAAASARAQAGVYFNPVFTHVWNSQTDAGPYAFLGDESSSANFGGISMGGYLDLLHQPKFLVGVDVRDELQHGNNALLNGFLVGARISPTGKQRRMRPYAEIAAGAATTHSGYSPVRKTKAEFKGYVGLDYRLNHVLDFRAFEVGYGSATTVSSSQYGGSPAVPAAQMLSVSAGLVFRFR